MGRAVAAVQDWSLPVALTVLAAAEVTFFYTGASDGQQVAMLAVLVPLALVTVRRRHEPEAVAVVTAALVLVFVLAVQRDLAAQPPLTPFLVVLVSLFSLGAHARGRRLLVGAGLAGTLLLCLQVAAVVAGRGISDALPSVLFWTAALVFGRLLHLSRRQAADERARAERAETERDRHVREAAELERTRIARELHDVVAHSLSLMVIQASVEARLLADGADSTAETLTSIERTGREALTELRRLLGLLRTDDDTALLQPLPTLACIDDVLDDVRRAGHQVTLAVHGSSREVPAGADLSAYRIAQEALTNAVKHAPGSHVSVAIDYRDDAILLEIQNNGPSVPPTGLVCSGHGLAGMRERVRVYGGELHAASDEDGGFVVRARIPSLAAEHG